MAVLYANRKTLTFIKKQGFYMARPERFELPTPWFVAKYSDPAELRARNEWDYIKAICFCQSSVCEGTCALFHQKVRLRILHKAFGLLCSRVRNG